MLQVRIMPQVKAQKAQKAQFQVQRPSQPSLLRQLLARNFHQIIKHWRAPGQDAQKVSTVRLD